MEILEITTGHPAYSFVERLLVDSFPEDERRDLSAQRHNTDSNPLMYCCVIIDNDVYAGLLTFWDFGDFRYVEHFATAPAARNRGLGARAMERFLEQSDKPVVLEVELPEDDLSRRRIGFYSRLGFDLWTGYDYVQPPYREGGGPLGMLLMASGGLDPAECFVKVVKTLHGNVYGVASE